MSVSGMRLMVLGAIGLLVTAPVVQAQSMGDYCRHYADQAVHEVNVARDHRPCYRFLDRNPARWNPDFRAHFDWCMANGGRGSREESEARRRDIHECRSDWRW